jgi:hypothetical protein
MQDLTLGIFLRLKNHRLTATDPNENRALQCLFEPAES